MDPLGYRFAEKMDCCRDSEQIMGKNKGKYFIVTPRAYQYFYNNYYT